MKTLTRSFTGVFKCVSQYEATSWLSRCAAPRTHAYLCLNCPDTKWMILQSYRDTEPSYGLWIRPERLLNSSVLLRLAWDVTVARLRGHFDTRKGRLSVKGKLHLKWFSGPNAHWSSKYFLAAGHSLGLRSWISSDTLWPVLLQEVCDRPVIHWQLSWGNKQPRRCLPASSWEERN